MKKILLISLIFTFSMYAQQDEYILEENHYNNTEFNTSAYDNTSEKLMNLTYILPHTFKFTTSELLKLQYGTIEIKHHFDLNNQDVDIPEGLTIIFNQGSLHNYKSLRGNNTKIVTQGISQILDPNGDILGQWDVLESYAEWFGAKGNGIDNDHDPIVRSLELAPTKLLEKTYFTSRIDLKSNQSLIGSGYETIVKSKGVIFTLGGIDAWSFTDSFITYSALEIPHENTYSIRLKNINDVAKYTEGEIIAIHSEEGYHDGAGTFKPMFQQLNKVKKINFESGTIYLADKLYKAYNGKELRVSKGEEIKNNNAIPSRLTQNILISDLSVKSESDSWSRFGGTYNTTLKNINSLKSSGLMIQNGFANSKAENIEGLFKIKVYDLAFFSHNSISTFGTCKVDEKSKLKFLFGFSEGSHNNIVIAKNVDCSNKDNSSLKDVIIFGQGSHNNSIVNSKINVYNSVRIMKSGHFYDVMTYKNNLIKNVDVNFTKCSTIIANNSNSTSAEMIIDSCTFTGNKITGNTINSNSSKLNITKCVFNTPKSKIRLSDKSQDLVIHNNTFFNKQQYISKNDLNFAAKNVTINKT